MRGWGESIEVSFNISHWNHFYEEQVKYYINNAKIWKVKLIFINRYKKEDILFDTIHTPKGDGMEMVRLTFRPRLLMMFPLYFASL